MSEPSKQQLSNLCWTSLLSQPSNLHTLNIWEPRDGFKDHFLFVAHFMICAFIQIVNLRVLTYILSNCTFFNHVISGNNDLASYELAASYENLTQ